ncbi:respiratory chain complex I subunit 1 family protein [Sporomusa sp. KB1]|jgi:formate hydrogenlyase subunit 4|uniref:respiratory chain complex I subunit 1 family protein n=1 Tax=Sporomusa sp. KB1 TaxID=943346 RepID=UPI0011A1914D|nr:NADH-quinone oxidoreductase subunit H [Sporomusa sp. KB1]TWH48251.1 formate hydrogenlyase subunit 4 [Sporomusa sp. KB1]
MEQLTTIVISLGYALAIVLAAPLVAGIIKVSKARLQNRRGPRVWQVYYDLFKLLQKDTMVSPTTSWVFNLAPYIYFAGAFGAAALLTSGDLFALLYLLAASRFFLALSSLDAGSTFGGMGGSREMYISVLVEPVLLVTMLTVAARAGSTKLAAMSAAAAITPFSLPYIFAAVAFLIILVAETGRIPVDNPDTHLELTMIHEAMVLEYSGRRLGLIFLAAASKQLVFILLFTILFLPWQPDGLSPLLTFLWLVAKVLLTAVALAAIESSTNKMRLFKVPGFMGLAGMLALLALVAQ